MAKESALVKAVRYPAYFILLIWAVHVFQLLPGIDLTHYGVRPRYVEGLWGILFSPLLHGSFGHLINNSIPFFALGSIIFFFFPACNENTSKKSCKKVPPAATTSLVWFIHNINACSSCD